MSSMRNAVSRRNHKERAQPEARQKWGILEKHKDYSLRAKDYNVKKQKLNLLSQKSRDRHPDEFSFGMLSADKGRQGRHGSGDQTTNKLSHDAVKLLKTQDSGYLRTIAARGRREIERLSEGVSLDLAMKKRSGENERKVLFDADGQPPLKKSRLSVEITDEDEMDVEEVQAANDDDVQNDVDRQRDDSDSDIGAPTQKSRKQLEREQATSVRLKAQKRRRKALRERRAAQLLQLKKRQKEIIAAADQLDLQRAKMARAIGGTNKNGIKFKVRERKR